MESPRPLRRPPAILGQSSSSLRGFERAIPSFQSFVKRTPPPPTQEKPLPPVPLGTHIDGALLPTNKRRSSSVYSRAVSHYAPTPESWQSRYLRASDMFLQPSVYSHSTPELVDRPSMISPPLSRTDSPLFASPATTPETSPSPSSCRTPSVLLPPPPPFAKIPSTRGHVKTVSLDKAKAAMLSPNNTPLLPEEMRALASGTVRSRPDLRKSRSLEDLPADNNASSAPPLLPPLLNLSDYKAPFLRPAAAHPLQSISGSSFVNKAIQRRPSDKSTISYEPRGKTTEREYTRPLSSHLAMDGIRYGPPEIHSVESKRAHISNSEELASEYYALFNDIQSATPPRDATPDSVESTRTHMKMVPQPLFFNPRQISEQRARQYAQQQFQQSPAATLRSDDHSLPRPDVLPKLNLFSQEHLPQRSNTDGSIAISPLVPSATEPSPTPLLGRFASPPSHEQARSNSPHLINMRPALQTHSTTQSTVLTTSTVSGMRSQTSSPSVTSLSRPQPVNLDSLPSAVARRIAAMREKIGHVAATRQKNSNNKSGYSASHRYIVGDNSSRTSSLASQSQSLRNRPSVIGGGHDAEEEFKGHGHGHGHSIAAGLRKGSVMVSDMLDMRRESKANKRREDLKRMIRVVPDYEENGLGEEGAMF